MRAYNRKSAPEVVGGAVKKKNNWELTPNYYSHTQKTLLFDRQRPGPGYRHLLLKKDLLKFINLLPDWEQLSEGLNAIVLAPGEPSLFGWHNPGVVHICAWETALWIDCSVEFYRRDQFFFHRLSVECVLRGGQYICKFTEQTARAYQLLNIFLHELGHHRDLMTTKSQQSVSRGEKFADRYAEVNSAYIWQRYQEEFGLD